jgi:hypothetical protein
MRDTRKVLRTDLGTQAQDQPRLLDARDLREAVSGMTERRRRSPKTFAVLTLIPQLMPGERLHRAEHAVATQTFGASLRSGDSYCAMDDDSYVVLLSGTTDDLALTVAHRLAQELLTRSANVQRRIWHAGVASYPRDGRTEAALMRLARQSALRSRESRPPR